MNKVTAWHNGRYHEDKQKRDPVKLWWIKTTERRMAIHALGTAIANNRGCTITDSVRMKKKLETNEMMSFALTFMISNYPLIVRDYMEHNPGKNYGRIFICRIRQWYNVYQGKTKTREARRSAGLSAEHPGLSKNYKAERAAGLVVDLT
jgi:hypothetical protein